MSFGKKKDKPVIPCNAITHITSKDIDTNIELNALYQQYDKQYQKNKFIKYRLIANKDNNFDIALSPLALNQFLTMLKGNISDGKLLSQHEQYHSISVNINIIYDSFDKNANIIKEFELINFGTVPLTDGFSNITELINNLLFFKLGDDISNLDIEQEYSNRKNIANMMLRILLAEDKDFNTQFIATIPNKEDFANQNTKSVYLPIFETKKDKEHRIELEKKKKEDAKAPKDNKKVHDDTQHEHPKNKSEDEHDNYKLKKESKKSSDDKKEYQKGTKDDSKTKGDKDEQNDMNNKATPIPNKFDEVELPFIPSELINNIKFTKPKYLFNVDPADKLQYKDINSAIQHSNFDFQHYLVASNNDYKKNANAFINSKVETLKNDLKAELIKLINDYYDEIEEKQKKSEKYLADNTKITQAANNYLRDEFFNKRQPALEQEREQVKIDKKNDIIQRAKMEIDQMYKKVDLEYDEKMKNAHSLIIADAENMANDKIKSKDQLRDKELKKVKKDLEVRLKNNIQSAFNNYNQMMQQTAYTLYQEFSKDLRKRQPALIDQVTHVIEEQVAINKSKAKMQELRKNTAHRFNQKTKSSGLIEKDEYKEPKEEDKMTAKENNQEFSSNNSEESNELNKNEKIGTDHHSSDQVKNKKVDDKKDSNDSDLADDTKQNTSKYANQSAIEKMKRLRKMTALD